MAPPSIVRSGEVAAGETAWPSHDHGAWEAGSYRLEGEATVRIGAESIAVHAGDYLASPSGPDHAHLSWVMKPIKTDTPDVGYLDDEPLART